MSNFMIEVFTKIIGVGSVSGIFFQANEIQIVSDNSNYLYTYHIDDHTLQKTLLFDNGANNENVEKKNKLDIESISKNNDSFYIFGSASRSNRNDLFIVNQKKQQVQRIDLSEQYHLIRNKLQIDLEDFNIEGSIFYENHYYLFNRGNGQNSRNGIIIIDSLFQKEPKFIGIDLKSNGTTPSFTDAILYKDKIYFLAAVEETASTYDDGKIGGSYIGTIDLKTLHVDRFLKISEINKFEGLTLFKEGKKSLEFLLCEDPDNEAQEATIYKLTVNK